MKTRAIASTLTIGLVAATSVAVAAAPSQAQEFTFDLERTMFASKSSILVDVATYVSPAIEDVTQIRATANGHSCTGDGLSCVINGVSSGKTTVVTVVGLNANGDVIATGSTRLKAVKRIKKNNVILCKWSATKHAMQVAGVPFNESSRMKSRVKIAPVGKSLPSKWRTGSDSWVEVGSLKAGKSYHYKAQAWNVNGWGPVSSGTATAGQYCQ